MSKRNSSIYLKDIKKGFACKILVLLLSLISFLLIGLYINYDKVSANDFSNYKKQVLSIEVKEGDTLWNIAKEYMNEEYSDINDYIKEIKLSNGLASDTIHEGSYLIIPYYAMADTNSSQFSFD